MKDHYVAQTYLEAFTNSEGMLSPYYKAKSVVLGKPKSLKAVCFEIDSDTNKYFSDPRIIDKYLPKFENPWKQNVQALRDRFLDGMVKYQISGYVAFLRSCTPTAKRLGQDRIRAAFAGQDWRSLEKLAHSLKSTSANIGAMELHEAAFVLEKHCKEASISLADEALIDKVGILLSQVLDSLQSLPAESGKQKVSPTLPLPDAARIIPMLKMAAKAIHLSDTESIGAELDHLREHLAPSLLESLESHICSYDYEEALEAIGDIERQLTDNQ